MQFARPPRRRKAEAIVPMINVVFLLLIFFLMTAQIAPPAPFDVTPPDARAERLAEGKDTLFVAADGRIAHDGEEGEAALERLARREEDTPLTIRADSALPATDLARLMTRLRALGIEDTEIVLRPR
ncbi:MAG: ExbD/TolR family protein [Paracoccaceae bacterium]